MKLPPGRCRGPCVQQGRPRFLFPPGNGQQVEVVRNVRTANELADIGREVPEGEHGHHALTVFDGPQLEPAAGSEGAGPLGLPGPGEKRRAQAATGVQARPGGRADRFEAVMGNDLHALSDETESGAGPASSAAVGSSDSSMASSMASSKSSPRSSPISRPMRFMSLPTLAGSFSSRSPRLDESAKASIRASSDLGVAKRDISRVRAEPPQRGQFGVGELVGRSTSMLTTRRQSRHSYS